MINFAEVIQILSSTGVCRPMVIFLLRLHFKHFFSFFRVVSGGLSNNDIEVFFTVVGAWYVEVERTTQWN